MKILFICPYPSGQAPSQRFRFEHYFNELENQHIYFEIHSFFSDKTWNIIYSTKTFEKIYGIITGFINRFKLLFLISKFDFIFIHREATPLGPPICEWLIAKILKKKIIYDFDDAIWLSDPDEKGTLKSLFKWKSKVRNICKWSYKVSVGNQYLAEYAKKYNSNVYIIPTVVDTENYHNPRKLKKENNESITLGWTGTHSTLQYLKKLIPLLKEVYFDQPFKLLIISNKAPDFEFPEMEFIQWSLQTEIQDLYRVDIGIMPLTDDAWSKGKCGFKVIQYMSLEIPSLASVVGVNTKIIEHEKNGFLCSNEDEWRKYLIQLIKDKNLRSQIGLKAREKIIKDYSVRSTETDFLGLFY